MKFQHLMGLFGFSTAVLGLPSTAQTSQDDSNSFNPYAYTKKFVTCPAVERSNGKVTPISLKLAYIDINPTAKKTLVMLHGWPSLWTTYRHQIEHFGKEYRLLIPEFRGFGQSQHPKDLDSSNTQPDFVNDVLCVMQHAGVPKGVCYGHDFGGELCWEAGRSRPDKFIAIFNIATPYQSASLGFATIAQTVQQIPSIGYQLYVSNMTDAAVCEMNGDIRSSIRATAQTAKSNIPADFLHSTTSFLGPWKAFEKEHNLKEIPFSGIMTPQLEDYMVAQYSLQGFRNTLNYYQNNNRNETYLFDISQGNFTIPQPTFSLFPTADPVLNWEALAIELGSANFLPNHFNATIATAHWAHEEMPDETNRLFEEWIGNVTFS